MTRAGVVAGHLSKSRFSVEWTRSGLNLRCEVHPHPPKTKSTANQNAPFSPHGRCLQTGQRSALTTHYTTHHFTGRRSQDKTPILCNPTNPSRAQKKTHATSSIGHPGRIPSAGLKKNHISPASSASNIKQELVVLCHRDNLTFTQSWQRQRRRISRGNQHLARSRPPSFQKKKNHLQRT